MATATVSSGFSLHNSPTISNRISFRGTQNPLNFKNRSCVCFSNRRKPGFFDQILDYIEGGPKLRKWYGAPDLLPKDGLVSDEDALTSEVEEDGQVRDAVLVTDGDNEIGQMIILALIVKRTRVKALVKDRRAAIEAFGTYVEPITGDTNNKSFQKKALKGVRSIICPTEGFLSQAESLRGVEHVILLSQLSVYRSANGIQALINGKARTLAEQDEAFLVSAGIPYTIIRAGMLQNIPGGEQGFSFKEGSAAQGSLSKEDAAFICVEALNAVPDRGAIFEVANGEEKVSDWKEFFSELIMKAD